VKSVPELVAAAKSGRTISYASPGAGSPMHFVGEWLNRSASVKMPHVPYRGVGPSVTDVVAGHVNTAWVTIGSVSQYMTQNRLVPLAIGDAKRSKLAPNVPTLSELGYKDVVVGSWNGFFAPKGTPKEIVTLLNTHLNAILQEPEVVTKLATYGAEPAGGAPEVLGRTNAEEYAQMSRLMKELGITAGGN
jgi:tripartite-type tricarboxylate transporter receptor subunit TctC